MAMLWDHVVQYPLLLKEAKTGILPITDPAMTRFIISLQVLIWCSGRWSMLSVVRYLYLKIPSYRITDVAEAIGPSCEKPIVGIRPGEKIHEEMVTESDSFTTIDLGEYYAILPGDGSVRNYYKKKGISFSSVHQGFAYNSGTNTDFLSVEQLQELIRLHVDPAFMPV